MRELEGFKKALQSINQSTLVVVVAVLIVIAIIIISIIFGSKLGSSARASFSIPIPIAKAERVCYV